MSAIVTPYDNYSDIREQELQLTLQTMQTLTIHWKNSTTRNYKIYIYSHQSNEGQSLRNIQDNYEELHAASIYHQKVFR